MSDLSAKYTVTSVNDRRMPQTIEYIDAAGEKQMLTFISPLKGRGQKEFGGFFADEHGKQFLIKIDKPGTCVMEGSAGWVADAGLLPTQLLSAVNFASAGSLVNQDGTTDVISIQPAVTPRKAKATIQGLDVRFFGHSRDPKYLDGIVPTAEEFVHKDSIKYGLAHISEKSQQATWELAAGLFASAAVGDDSVHTAQFMSILDAGREVVGVTRLDHGARGRNLYKKVLQNDIDVFNTSKVYSERVGSQRGNQYITYYLQNQDVAEKYAALWAREMDFDIIKRKSAERFVKQFADLPDPQKEIGLLAAVKAIGFSPKKRKEIKEQLKEYKEKGEPQIAAIILAVAVEVGKLDKVACQRMQRQAQKYLADNSLSGDEILARMPPPLPSRSPLVAAPPLPPKSPALRAMLGALQSAMGGEAQVTSAPATVGKPMLLGRDLLKKAAPLLGGIVAARVQGLNAVEAKMKNTQFPTKKGKPTQPPPRPALPPS